MPDINTTISATVITAAISNPPDVAASLGVTQISATITDGIDVSATVSEEPITPTLVNGGSISASVTQSPISATISMGIDDAPADDITYGRKNNAWIEVDGGAVDSVNGQTGDVVLDFISGSGVAGRLAEFADPETLQAANLIAPSANILTLTNEAAATLALNITAGKTLSLTAADNYTLTIPATGTAALLGVENVFAAAQKINVNSTTALVVEQDGVKDNVLVVDTTNGRVGFNTVPDTSLVGQILASDDVQLGSELITNNTFNGTAGWGNTTNWTMNGAAVYNGTVPASDAITQTITGLTIGQYYYFEIYGTVNKYVDVGGTSIATRYFFDSTPASSYGYHRYAIGFVATTTSINMSIIPTGLSSGNQVTYVTLKRIIGYSSPSLKLKNSVGNSGFEVRSGTDGTENVLLGVNSGRQLVGGYYNTILGYGSGVNIVSGSSNFLAGKNAGANIVSGNNNILIGFKSGQSITTGGTNIFVGANTGINVTDGSFNTVVGHSAGGWLGGNFSGLTALGFYAGRDFQTGKSYSVLIGSYAGMKAGSYSVVIGYDAGRSLNNADNNVIIGYRSGYYLTTGASNIFIGQQAGYRQTTNSNLLIIDNQQRADIATEQSNSIIYGVMAANPASQTLRINAKTTISGDLDFIADSQGVILKDRTTGTNYRLYVSAGSLLIESV